MGALPDLAPLAGPWGSLTVVNHDFAPVTTEAQTDVLNENGKPTGAEDRRRDDGRIDPAAARRGQPGAVVPQAAGRYADRPRAGPEVLREHAGRPRVCVRRAALRQRQQLRRQRRGHLLPGRRQAHLLLRVPGDPAAHERDDHHPEAGHRRTGRRQPVFPVQREHLLRRQRLQALKRPVDGLLPRRRPDLERRRGRGGQLPARSHRLHQRRWDEHFHHHGVDRPYPSGGR